MGKRIAKKITEEDGKMHWKRTGAGTLQSMRNIKNSRQLRGDITLLEECLVEGLYANLEFTQRKALEIIMHTRQHTLLGVQTLRNIDVRKKLFIAFDPK